MWYIAMYLKYSLSVIALRGSHPTTVLYFNIQWIVCNIFVVAVGGSNRQVSVPWVEEFIWADQASRRGGAATVACWHIHASVSALHQPVVSALLCWSIYQILHSILWHIFVDFNPSANSFFYFLTPNSLCTILQNWFVTFFLGQHVVLSAY